MSKFQVNDMIDSIVDEQRRKIHNAVKHAESVAKRRIEEIIPVEMASSDKTGAYYEDYTPKYYKRTGQLGNSVGAYAETRNIGGVISLQIGVEDESPFGPAAMHHKGSKKRKPDEKVIFENFLSGVHPNVYGLGNDLQGTNIEENINRALDDLLEHEIIPMINSAVK